MKCPFCGEALEYDDGISRYTCPNGCVIKWSLEEMYDALAAEVARLRAENDALRARLDREAEYYCRYYRGKGEGQS